MFQQLLYLVPFRGHSFEMASRLFHRGAAADVALPCVQVSNVPIHSFSAGQNLLGSWEVGSVPWPCWSAPWWIWELEVCVACRVTGCLCQMGMCRISKLGHFTSPKSDQILPSAHESWHVRTRAPTDLWTPRRTVKAQTAVRVHRWNMVKHGETSWTMVKHGETPGANLLSKIATNKKTYLQAMANGHAEPTTSSHSKDL